VQDLITVAVNEGLRRAQEMVNQEMSKLSPLAGINLSNIFGGRS
jgi:hypothetical protein